VPSLAYCAEAAAPAAPKGAAPAKVRLSFIEDFLLSGTSAVVSKTIAAPIERIKMVIQNEGEMIRRGTIEKSFGGIGGAASHIMKNEGFAAFWRSNFTNCLRYFPTQALNFAFKGRIKSMFKSSPNESYPVKFSKNIAAGGCAGGLSLCFVYSLDYARTKLANDMKSTAKGAKDREYSGLIDVYKKTLKSDGFVGLYRGFNISFVGIFVYRGLYFGLYDSVIPMLGKDVNPGVKFAVGYVVTVVSGLASYPIDTIRRRMMMTSGGSKELMYKGSIDCAVQTLKNEGAMAFMKGAGANILRGVAGAGVLAGFDELKKYYCLFQYGTTEVY
jgi:solute carrier family 25 (adenine nucleotide translocator) protein 4/5/6/31